MFATEYVLVAVVCLQLTENTFAAKAKSHHQPQEKSTSTQNDADREYPEISKDRIQQVSWKDAYLKELHENADSNKKLFYSKLYRDFQRKKRLKSKRGKVGQSAESVKTRLQERMWKKFEESRYLRPEHMAQEKIDSLILAHNDVRSNVQPTADQMIRLSWDYELEANSWSRIEACRYDFSIPQNIVFGENLWVGWERNLDWFEPNEAVNTWFKERPKFHQNLQTCLGGPCERYVQMVWFDAQKMGCAWKECANFSVHGQNINLAIFMACYYEPTTMEETLIPYFVGRSCSFCDPYDLCESNLCANSTREKVTGRKPWPDVETTAASELSSDKPALSSEAVTALTVVGSLMGTTLLTTITIAVAVKISRNNPNGKCSRFLHWICCCLKTSFETDIVRSNTSNISKITNDL